VRDAFAKFLHYGRGARGPLALEVPVASRQEEKQRRRQERIERERAEARAAARRKRVQLVGGAVLGLAALAAVIVAVVVGTSGGDSESEQPAAASEADIAKLPAQQTSDYQEAAKAAGCTLTNPPYEGAGHEDKAFKASDYKTNPPTSGAHTPVWAQDGVYAPGDTPPLGQLVHTLEHGRIDVQYKKGTPASTISQLEALLAEQSGGYHMLLFENPTNMKPEVAATAWTHSLTCPTMNDKVFDAIRTFRARYIDKGPENVP
jgi:hypothetical protein